MLGTRGQKCPRCALRLRIRNFQQTRSQSSARQHRTDATALDSPSRFLKPYQTYRPLKDRRSDSAKPSFGRTRSSNLPKKVTNSTNPKQWPAAVESKDVSHVHNFGAILVSRMSSVRDEIQDMPLLRQLIQSDGHGGNKSQFRGLWRSFTQKMMENVSESSSDSWKWERDERAETAVRELKEAFRTRGVSGMDDRIKLEFYAHVTNGRFTESEIKNQKAIADLRYPSEWFPATRMIPRTIHMHVGPTNSGKTYQALKRLEQAKSGVYAGPLRLLAHEVYTRLNAKGKACALVTGEERRVPVVETENNVFDMSACTVEMMPLNKTIDVAVIDEIQMIGSAERGWAWTQALLGVKAKEVHLCGEERTVPLIQEICASLGEKLEVHRYKRLSPLQVAQVPLDGDLSKLQKGDCIVSFSIMGIHALRRQIEKQTGRKVATVYGSLPPETRAAQARLFNDPDNDYDFLVASDAVGMGLNLSIKRIIFESATKFDGVRQRRLSIADIKQIGGRAGRYRTAFQATEQSIPEQDLMEPKPQTPNGEENVGLVTTLERFDFPFVKTAMTADPEPITSAGLFPPVFILERFASYFPPGAPFSYILTRLHEVCQTHNRFHLCGLKDQVWIADLIEPVEGLTISDRNIFCAAPASKSDRELWVKLMPAYARCVAQQSSGNIVDIPELPLELLDAPLSTSREYLRRLEQLHKGIVAYLWLSYRFAGIFSTRALAHHVKTMVEEKIEKVLSQFSFSESMRRKIVHQREQNILQSILAGEDGVSGGAEETRGSPTVRSEGSLPEPATASDRQDPGIQETADGIVEQKPDLDEQTSLISGGDRFGGEEDIAIEEPVSYEEEVDEQGTDFIAGQHKPTIRRRTDDSSVQHEVEIDQQSQSRQEGVA